MKYLNRLEIRGLKYIGIVQVDFHLDDENKVTSNMVIPFIVGLRALLVSENWRNHSTLANSLLFSLQRLAEFESKIIFNVLLSWIFASNFDALIRR